MAYAAVISLKLTIYRLLNSPKTCILPPSREILEYALKNAGSLQRILQRLHSNICDSAFIINESAVNALNGEIREAAFKLEDALESHVSNQFLSMSSADLAVATDVLKQEINSFEETAKKMEDGYRHIEQTGKQMEGHYVMQEIMCFFKEELDSTNAMPTPVSSVDFSNQIGEIRDYLTEGGSPCLDIISLLGIVGSGKTMLAREVFRKPSISRHFRHRCFVTVGPNYDIKEVMLAILSQLNHEDCEGATIEQVGVALDQSLYETKYLIVLDDVRNKKCWDELRQYLPDHKNGSRVLVTTRLEEVAEYVAPKRVHKMLPLSRTASWTLFLGQSFGPIPCPSHLKQYAEQIVEACWGHPLSIVAFARLLSKAKKIDDYWFWEKVVERRDSFFIEAYEQMLKVPLLRYDNKCQMSKEKKELESSKSKNMIGLQDQFREIKDLLTTKEQQPWPNIISIFAMVGIGKTTLARKLFEDKSIRSCFDICAFVTVGQKYKIKEIMRAIVSQICGVQNEEEECVEAIALYRCLKGRRYLIVLDDVWSTKCRKQLYLPDGLRGSQILVTTRLEEVAKSFCSRNRAHRMRFLSEEESLNLLREKVFGQDQLFPDYQFEKAAKKIIENCQGLPLAIIAVADLLSKNKTPQYWNEVAEKGHSVFRDLSDGMSEELIKSYNHLPQDLKACFLYMGVFPPNFQIPISKLIELWIAEEFLEKNMLRQSLEDFARECLDNLACKSDLILVHKQSSNSYRAKTCHLHPLYWYLCNKEAEKEKFSHVVNIYADADGIERQRRLCIHNNILFGIKNVYNKMVSDTSMARSILCTGPRHQYPLSILCSHWELLRVLDALTIRFYKFPVEVAELVMLRYLALTYSGKVHHSISKLRNLQYLIIHRHLSIARAREDWSYLPIEIWNMQELRCLEVMGNNLPYHSHVATLSLPNLLTLSFMGADSCTKEILEKTPNLKKLGIQIELAPSDIATDIHPLHCLDHLYVLRQLEALKCVVENPNPTSQVVALPAFFPPSLERLSLSGLGYPWEYMRIIAQLPKLKVLKLRCYAFRGPKWWMQGFDFYHLEFLLIEDTDLENWGADKEYTSWIERLIIRNCYNLKEIPIRNLGRLSMLELVDCPLALGSVKEMHDKKGRLQVCVKSSWNEKCKS